MPSESSTAMYLTCRNHSTARASQQLAYRLKVRKNTLLALILLLTAITIAGFLGALRMWQLFG